MRKRPGIHYGWRLMGIGIWMAALAIFIGSSTSTGNKRDMLGAIGVILLILGAACVEFSAPKTQP